MLSNKEIICPDNLLNFAKKKKDPTNAHLKSAYNKFRNSVNNDIKSSKKDYNTKYFENCKNTMNKTWKGINDIIRSNKKTTYINQINHNNHTAAAAATTTTNNHHHHHHHHHHHNNHRG